MKDQDPELFIKAIEKVHSGEVWLDRTFMADVIDQISDQVKTREADREASRIGLLTQREREVLIWFARRSRIKRSPTVCILVKLQFAITLQPYSISLMFRIDSICCSMPFEMALCRFAFFCTNRLKQR